MFDRALKLKPGNLYIQQNYDLFREADDKRNRKKKPTTLRLRLPPRTFSHSIASALRAAGAGGTGCATVVEVPVETPVQSKIDVSRFRRVLVAGFVTDLAENDVELGSETSRLLQNQLRSNSRLQVLEPDHPPLQDALEQALEKLGEGGSTTSRNGSSTSWRRTACSRTRVLAQGGRGIPEPAHRHRPRGLRGAEPLRLPVRGARRARPGTNRPRLVRANRYLERKGFSLSAEFYFIDGRTGQNLHKEKFTEEVLYGEEQKISPLSSYFELMDRLIPNFLGVISPQKVRGTRVLLR
jgi:hypothetical protein